MGRYNNKKYKPKDTSGQDKTAAAVTILILIGAGVYAYYGLSQELLLYFAGLIVIAFSWFMLR